MNDSFPKVKKCPNCGEVIPALATSCPACGYEFRDVAANSSAKQLSEKLMAIDNDFRYRSIEDTDAIIAKDQAKASAISTFPVPNTKEDLFEFMIMAKEGRYNESNGLWQQQAYETKLKECVAKAHYLCPTDPSFQTIIADIEKETKNKKKKERIFWGIVIFIFVVACCLLGILS